MRSSQISSVLVVLSLGAASLLAGCQTSGPTSQTQDDLGPVPTITETMPLNEALKGAINHGGEVMPQVKRLITRRGEWPTAMQQLNQAITDGIIKYQDNQLANAVNIYQSSPVPASVELFERLIGSARPLARQLGWQIAASMPSPQVAAAIDRELTRALKDDDEQNLLQTPVAQAVTANRMTAAYTLMRQGLMATGEESFAIAMASLEPRQASDDFMRYIARAPVEELRQLTMTSVNVYTCAMILRHMMRFGPAVTHQNFDHLFLYSVSRNQGLAELAELVLQSYLPARKEQLAYTLARLPGWVQIAYVESARRRMSPSIGLFLAELKKTSSRPEVIEEIDESRN